MSARGAAVTAVILAALIALVLWMNAEEPGPVAVVTEPVPIPAEPSEPPDVQAPSAGASVAEAEPPEIELPPLGMSDAFVREHAFALSSGGFDDLLSTDQLLRRFTAVLEQAAEGGVAREPIAHLLPQAPFRVLGDEAAEGDAGVMDPRNFDRFDAAVATLSRLDVDQAAQTLALFEPLIRTAYGELGVQDAEPRARVLRAIDLLLATPSTPADVPLVRRSVAWEFADPALEDLKPSQKLLIRMGPQHAATIKAKLTALRAALLDH